MNQVAAIYMSRHMMLNAKRFAFPDHFTVKLKGLSVWSSRF